MEGDYNEERRFPCNYCDRLFMSSQALGGHQNGHRREREAVKKAQQEAHLLAMQMPPPPPPQPLEVPSYPPANNNPHQPLPYNPQNFVHSPTCHANRLISRHPYYQTNRPPYCAHHASGAPVVLTPRFAPRYSSTSSYNNIGGTARDEDLIRFASRYPTGMQTFGVEDPRVTSRFHATCPHVVGMARDEEQRRFVIFNRNLSDNNGAPSTIGEERGNVAMAGPSTANQGAEMDSNAVVVGKDENEIDLTLRL